MPVPQITGKADRDRIRQRAAARKGNNRRLVETVQHEVELYAAGKGATACMAEISKAVAGNKARRGDEA